MNTTLTFPFFSPPKSNSEEDGAEKALVKFKIAAIKKAIFICFSFPLSFGPEPQQTLKLN
jgi:hypothetical protein